MGTKFKLPRLKQCETCPWKKGSDVNNIPDYLPEQHLLLKSTIAEEGQIFGASDGKVMSCHYSTGDDGMMCIGWVDNQLNHGNNIWLRIRMMDCQNVNHIKTVGEQHERFEDTLPECLRGK